MMSSVVGSSGHECVGMSVLEMVRDCVRTTRGGARTGAVNLGNPPTYCMRCLREISIDQAGGAVSIIAHGPSNNCRQKFELEAVLIDDLGYGRRVKVFGRGGEN